jgi:mono/diheme cytochrome c family protein
MGGGRSCLVLVNIVGVSMFLACGDRRTGDAPATDTAPTVSPAPPSSDTAATLQDSGQALGDSARPASRGDSTTARTPVASPAAAPTRQGQAAPKRVNTPKPVLRPSTPAAPAAAQRDTPPASTSSATQPARNSATASTPPAQTATPGTPSAQADAPLRDQYHRAPLDTVTQQVYDGWKQFNLNCARCHGEDVQGTTIAPHLVTSLKPDGPINTKELFVQTVCAGRPAKGMPAWCPLGLEMDKIEAIYSYVKGRSDGKIRTGRPAVKSQG